MSICRSEKKMIFGPNEKMSAAQQIMLSNPSVPSSQLTILQQILHLLSK